MLIKGVTVTLYEKTQTGTDAFGAAVYEEIPVNVDNVLIAPTTSESDNFSRSPVNVTGNVSIYTLAIPKGDTHEWRNSKVAFFGRTGRTIGDYSEGIETYMPLEWHKKIRVQVVNNG